MTADDGMDVIEQAQAGEANALEILSSQYSGRVFKIALGITKHWQDAEDVLQETLLLMCTKIDQFRGESQFATWLSRVSINQALTCQRKRTRSKAVSLDSTSETDDRCFLLEPPDRRPDPEQQFRHAESAKCVGAALRRLPPSIRRLFLLHHLYDVPIQEAANALGITASAAKSRLVRARRFLRERLVQYHTNLYETHAAVRTTRASEEM